MPRSPSGASARPSPRISIKSLELNALHTSQIQDMVHLNGNRSNRDSPDDSRIGADVRGFPAFRQDRSEFRTATVTSDGPNGGRGADLAIFAGIWTHSSHRQLLNA